MSNLVGRVTLPEKREMNRRYGPVGRRMVGGYPPPVAAAPVPVYFDTDSHEGFTPGYMIKLSVTEPPVEVQRNAAKIVKASLVDGVFTMIAWFSEPTFKQLKNDHLSHAFVWVAV